MLKHKVPLMAVVGPKEVEGRTLSLRSRHNVDDIGTVPVDEFISRLQLAVANKSSLEVQSGLSPVG
jgi:threonyl-tRNA synthetase